MKNVLKVVAAAAAAFVLPGLLTACDGTTDEDMLTPPPSVAPEPTASTPIEQFTGYKEFVAEYEEAVVALTPSLPGDAQIDQAPQGEWDPKGQYEPGSGEMQAAFQWQCAWIEVYVEAKSESDRTTIDKALQRLSDWTSLTEVSPHVDEQSKQVWADEVVGNAMEGDDAFLISLAEDCS